MELPDGLALDFHPLFDATPIPNPVLTPDFTMVAANEARLRATMTTREQIIGRNLFDAFPDNPADPTATGVGDLRASPERCFATGGPTPWRSRNTISPNVVRSRVNSRCGIGSRSIRRFSMPGAISSTSSTAWKMSRNRS